MKKGYYIVYGALDGAKYAGVNIKIKGQIKALNNAGIKTKEKIYKIDDTPIAKILYRLPFINAEPTWKYSHAFDDVDFIYLRKPYLSLSFIWFLKVFKWNSRAKIIIEFPTYPYDGEITRRVIDYPLFIKDYIARHFLKGKVDRIVCIAENKRIYGVDTLRIMNGYDFSQMSIKRPIRKDDEIRLCCVARFMPAHGYERLLRGLVKYYQNGGMRNIQIYFVGDGNELDLYRQITKNGNIEDHVVYFGYKSSNEVEEILNRSDFGVAALGMFKVNYNGVGAYLKTREYLAVGLPIIVGNRMDIKRYPELRKYMIEYKNNNSDIDISRIIDYFDDMQSRNKNGEEHIRIRKLAEKFLNMDAAMKEVVDYIKYS